MSASLVITVKTEMTQAVLQQKYQKPVNQVREEALALSHLFRKLASLHERGEVTVQTGASAPVAASGTITLANVSADDTIVIGATTLTAKASPSGENQFSQAGTDSVDAAGLVTKINAHSVLSLLVFASAVNAIVTVTALQKGNDGNAIPLTSSNGTRLAVSGSGFLASGTGGTDDVGVVYTLGL